MSMHDEIKVAIDRWEIERIATADLSRLTPTPERLRLAQRLDEVADDLIGDYEGSIIILNYKRQSAVIREAAAALREG